MGKKVCRDEDVVVVVGAYSTAAPVEVGYAAEISRLEVAIHCEPHRRRHLDRFWELEVFPK
jgi:hypothetical protein